MTIDFLPEGLVRKMSEAMAAHPGREEDDYRYAFLAAKHAEGLADYEWVEYAGGWVLAPEDNPRRRVAEWSERSLRATVYSYGGGNANVVWSGFGSKETATRALLELVDEGKVNLW